MNSRLTVVIPAYNEEGSLPVFLPELVRYCKERHFRIVVVDDGSSDKTGLILTAFAQRGDIQMIRHKLNRGYGGAIKTGLEAAETEYVITMDADGQHRVEDIQALYDKIVSSNADMVVGSRKGLKSATAFRGIGKWVIRRTASLLMPLPIHDINSGMKIYRTELAHKYLRLLPNSMSYSDIIVLFFINQRHLVLEHPIVINERISGESTIGVDTALDTVREIVNIIVLFDPMKVFLPAAALLAILGVAWGLPIVVRGGGVSVGASLLIISGILLLFLGLIAEQLSAIRKADLR